MTENYGLHEHLYQDQYKKSYFINYDKPLDDENDEEDGESSYIIEIGFCLFFIISNISDRKITSIKEDEEDLEALEYLKENEASQGVVGNILSNFTILNQGLSLGKNIFNTGFDFMKKIKKNMVGTLSNREKTQLEEFQKLKKSMEFKELKSRALKFYKSHSSHIEIARENKFYKIYFPLLPECSTLPKPIKREFHEKVNRTSVKTKVSDLLDQADYFIDVITHEQKLKTFFSKNKFFGIISAYEKFWENLAFYINLTLNFIIIASYSEYNAPIGATTEEIDYYRLEEPTFFNLNSQQTLFLFKILGILNLIFSGIVIILFWMKRGPLITGMIWRQLYKTFDSNKDKLSTLTKGIMYSKAILQSTKAVLTNFTMLFYLLYICFLILGITFHPFFYAFHLSDFLRISILKNVIKAIWNPKYQIFLTLIFFILVEYYFSIISYSAYYEHYYEENSAPGRILSVEYEELSHHNIYENSIDPLLNFIDNDFDRKGRNQLLFESKFLVGDENRILANETIVNNTNTSSNDTNTSNNSNNSNTTISNETNTNTTNQTTGNTTNETIGNSTNNTNGTNSNNNTATNGTNSNSSNNETSSTNNTTGNETNNNTITNNSNNNSSSNNNTTNDSNTNDDIIHWRCDTLWKCFISTIDFTFKVKSCFFINNSLKT